MPSDMPSTNQSGIRGKAVARDIHEKSYSQGEEIAHAITHGIGLLLTVIGLILLLVRAVRYGDAWCIVASAIYGGSLVLLYTTSTFYHALPRPRAKRVFQLLDHSAIYMLIAGTYTPFTLISLRGGWGWTLFGLAWGLGLLGIGFELIFHNRFQKLSMLLYLALGWLIVIAARPLMNALPPGALVLIAVGGIFYSLGVIFYAWRKIPYHHAIWHLFVLGGSITHYFAVYLYVLPGPGTG